MMALCGADPNTPSTYDLGPRRLGYHNEGLDFMDVWPDHVKEWLAILKHSVINKRWAMNVELLTKIFCHDAPFLYDDEIFKHYTIFKEGFFKSQKFKKWIKYKKDLVEDLKTNTNTNRDRRGKRIFFNF